MAKKKRRGSSQPGVDPNEVRRQKLEARRAAKVEALREKEKRDRREKLVRRAALIVLATGVVWFLFLRQPGIPDTLAGHTVEHFSTAGANQHTNSTVAYDTSPPVSGEHAFNAAPCGIHATQIPNENMVHALEHGSVGLIYAPTLEAASISAIEGIVSGYDDHVFSEPYADPMDSPIAVVAWGHMMRLDTVDQVAITQFIDAFRGDADSPEATTPCDNTENAPFQPSGGGTETPLPDATSTGG
jgi:hypothetical protein